VLLEDSQGRIWVGTSGGVSLYQAGAWQTFTADTSPLAPGEVTQLLEDSQGRIWVGSPPTPPPSPRAGSGDSWRTPRAASGSGPPAA